MCTGRVDLSFIVRAFENGADGVIIGGCWPGECHYVTEGNYDALGNMLLCKRLLEHVGVRPDRLRLEWIAASEGARFSEVMSDFARQVRELGPIGEAEGLQPEDLKLRLASIAHLVPYLKLVEREKLRAPVRTEEAVREWYGNAETDRLFQQLIAEKIALSQILLLLADGPLSTGQISHRLSLTPSEVARHMNTSSSQGLVRYDRDAGHYALA